MYLPPTTLPVAYSEASSQLGHPTDGFVAPVVAYLVWRVIERITRTEETMLAAIAAVLFVMWLLGLVAFHVTGGVIHILLVLAIISLIIHLFRGRSAVA